MIIINKMIPSFFPLSLSRVSETSFGFWFDSPPLGFDHIEAYHKSKWSSFHLFKAHGQRALRASSRNSLMCQKKSRWSRGTVVVHIENRDPAQTTFIEGSLTTRGVPINVANGSLLDLSIANPSIGQSFAHGFFHHVRVIKIISSSRFLKLNVSEQTRASMEMNGFKG